MGFLSSHLGQRPNGLGGQETSPSTPIYSGGEEGLDTPAPGASTSSSSIVLGEALLEFRAPPPPPRRPAASGRSLPQPLPLSLLDQEGGDVTLTVHVLNTEVPSVRR